jgi:two-component system, OmpR family, phosphate regulon sensor histidine kinase PhoR
MAARRSLRWPVTLGVVLMLLVVTLTVGWVIVNIVAAKETTYPALFWTVLAIGATLLVMVQVGVVLYLVLTIKAIRLNQRQSNFIDAVTHELKSPIASLKLYLQTMSRHQVSAEQQSDFHRVMLEDVERLDQLIDHLLDAARLEQLPANDGVENVSLKELLTRCAHTACQRYRLPESTVQLQIQPVTVPARPADLEIVFRNLLDNALKYSGDQPQVEIETHTSGKGRVVTRISDNGPGIPVALRRKVFSRFVRLGSELERKTPGTGLGLYIVRTLVSRMGGKIQVHGRGGKRGTVFEVDLPAASV